MKQRREQPLILVYSVRKYRSLGISVDTKIACKFRFPMLLAAFSVAPCLLALFPLEAKVNNARIMTARRMLFFHLVLFLLVMRISSRN